MHPLNSSYNSKIKYKEESVPRSSVRQSITNKEFIKEYAEKAFFVEYTPLTAQKNQKTDA